MTRPALRVALAFVPVLALALAACAPEPAVEATPPAPAVSEPAASPQPTEPGSRVPADCAALFASDAVSGGTATVVTRDDVFFRGTLDQAGSLACEYDGAVGGLGATLTVFVSVDQPATALDEEVASAAAFGLPTALAGEESWSTCVADDEMPFCRSRMLVGAYSFELIVVYGEASPAEYAVAVPSFLVDLAELASGWPDAVAAWQRPADALAWSDDCEGAVRAQQDVVRDAVPFDVGDAVTGGSGDGALSIYRAHDATELVYCSWGGPQGSFDLRILPGAAWMHEAGVVLPGTPVALDGALAAGLQTATAKTAVLTAFIDGSLVQVDMFVDSGASPEQVARDVIAALAVAF
ncbi:hypothetical protein [Microcella sp.]|uniref:hypothetical protein n=1 Tax=Microcella sp. TaxID=1913979 RepID=UPI003F72438A